MALTTITSILRPGVFIEFDPTAAGSSIPALPNKIVYIGSRLTTGTVAAGVVRQIINDSDGDVFWGTGSHLANMIEVGRKATPSGQIIEQYAVALDDDGTAAAGSIAFTGPTTAAGTLRIRIGGRPLAVNVPSGTAASAVPALLIALDHARFPVALTDGTGGVLTITARNEGVIGNDISILVDELPAGLTYVTTAMASGATNPSIATALTAIAGLAPQRICMGYSDSTNIGLLNVELAARADWSREQYAHGIVGLRSSSSSAITTGGTYNSRFLILALFSASPAPPWEIAAWTTMVDASIEDPSGNRDGATGVGLAAPATELRLASPTEELVLRAGVTVLRADDYGNVFIVRMVTTYKTNAQSVADPSWRDSTTGMTMWALAYTTDVHFSTKWAGAKIADDSSLPPPIGHKILTPSRTRKEMLLVWDDIWVPSAWVEDGKRAAFEAQLQTMRNATDVNRMDIFARPDIINSLHVIAIRMGFVL